MLYSNIIDTTLPSAEQEEFQISSISSSIPFECHASGDCGSRLPRKSAIIRTVTNGILSQFSNAGESVRGQSDSGNDGSEIRFEKMRSRNLIRKKADQESPLRVPNKRLRIEDTLNTEDRESGIGDSR